jgi:hypothetical protein
MFAGLAVFVEVPPHETARRHGRSKRISKLIYIKYYYRNKLIMAPLIFLVRLSKTPLLE